MKKNERRPPFARHAHLQSPLGDAGYVAAVAGRVRGAHGQRARRVVLGGGAAVGVHEAGGGGHGGAVEVHRGQVQVRG